MRYTVQQANNVFDDIFEELLRAAAMHDPYNSAHEAHSIIREEFEEFWYEVKLKSEKQDPSRMRAELVQLATTAVLAIIDLQLFNAESERAAIDATLQCDVGKKIERCGNCKNRKPLNRCCVDTAAHDPWQPACVTSYLPTPGLTRRRGATVACRPMFGMEVTSDCLS